MEFMLPEGEVFMEMTDSYTMPEHYVTTGAVEKRILLGSRKHSAPCTLAAQLEWGRDLGSMSLCPLPPFLFLYRCTSQEHAPEHPLT